MTRRRATRIVSMAAAVAAASAFAAVQAPAQQQPKGPPNALQGFSANRDKPVRIQAASLEVRNKDKVATFSGDVHVTQGDTNLRCKILMVFYEDDPTRNAMPAAQPGPGGQQRIRRMEGRGGVVVTQKDQVATGDAGEFDMHTNTVTLTGNVVVTRGQDVLRGQRLVVDLTNGVSRVDSGRGRVEVLVDTKGMHPAKSGQPQGQPPSAPRALQQN